MNEQTIKKKHNLVLIFALIYISGCGSGGGSVTTPDEPDPIPSPDSSVPACSNYSSIENTQYCSFTKDGLTREFYIYVPSGYSENISPVPVLFSLHGGGDYAETNMQYSGFKEHADTDTFILIYHKAPIMKIKEQQDGIQKKVALMM